MPQVEFYMAWNIGLGTVVIGQVPWDNGHEAVLMGQLFKGVGQWLLSKCHEAMVV